MDVANHKSTIVIVVLAVLSTLQAVTIAAMSNGWKPWTAFAEKTAENAATMALSQASSPPVIQFQVLVPKNENEKIGSQHCTEAAIQTFNDFGIRPKALQRFSLSESREKVKIRVVCTDSDIGAIYVIFAYPQASLKSAISFSTQFKIYFERNLKAELKRRAF